MWDPRAIPFDARRADAHGPVEGPSIAHALPELYRRLLDRVAALELLGHRHEADRIRAAAVTAYSAAWDDAAMARLEALRIRAERVHDGQERPRHPSRVTPAVRLRLRLVRTGA